MTRRVQLNKERKDSLKNLIKREQNRAYKILIFSMIMGVLNYVFWHDQFIGLDQKYYLFFVGLSLLAGLYFYWAINKIFIKDIFDTKTTVWWDSLLSSLFMLLIALFYSYFSLVTISNVVFKLAMDAYTKDKPVIYKTYTVTSTYKNDRGRGIHLFSHIRYVDEDNKMHNYDVLVDEVETSDERRRITFKCQQGFWDYYKIIDYKMESFQ